MKFDCFIAVCEPPTAPEDGSLWVSGDGMSLLYTCDTGFSLNGADNNSCGHDGTGWKYAHPTCGNAFFYLSKIFPV